jgi:hypothetical protein
MTAIALLLAAAAAPAPLPACSGADKVPAADLPSYLDISGSPFYRFAAAKLGAPKACSITYKDGEDGPESLLVVDFADGSRAFFQHYPPGISISGLRLAKGFASRAEALKLLREMGKEFKVDFEKPSTEERAGGGGLYEPLQLGPGKVKVVTFDAPDGQFNAKVDLLSVGGKPTAVGFHMAD